MLVTWSDTILVMDRLDDGSLRMYYTGVSSDGATSFGVARRASATMGSEWVREQATITFAIE
jgi:hypothetical protein